MKKYLIPFVCILSYSTLSAQVDRFVPSSNIIFEYDEAGNQIYRGTGTPDPCITCRENQPLAERISNKINAAPVPVDSELNIIWDISIKDYILRIDILPYNSFTVLQSANIANLKDNRYVFNMSGYSYGVYYLKFYLSDGTVYTRTIIKN